SLPSGERRRTRNHGHYVCSTWGNNHFKTFDGDIYQFPGMCEYNFVSDCQDSYREFSVHIQRALNSNNHPEIQYILITITDFTVYLKPKLAVVDGRIVKTPYYSSGLLIESNDVYTKVYAKLGLILIWNQEDALMVELDSKFGNQTCGLCGDYNGVPIYNEFISGGDYNSITYGNLQKISKPNDECEDPDETQALPSCNEHRDECEKLLTSSAFADCHSRLNLEMYIQACMQDKCSCKGNEDSFCLCSTISEYSRQCSHAGGRPGEWRTENFCYKTCPGNMVYRESSSPCMDTCSHLEVSSLCEEHYMDGCFCPEGTVYDDITENGCVPVSQCYCRLHGKGYSPGETISNECEECTCDSGRWTCKDLPCPGTCSVEGGSHITTFDGKKYTFHGDCYYVLAKSAVNNTHALLAELAPCGSTDGQTCLKTVVLLVDDKKNVVVFRSDGSVSLNEMTVNVPHVSASFSVFKPSSYYLIVHTSFGLQLQIQLSPVMQLFVTMDQSVQDLQGLCGNFNGMEGDDFKTTSGLVEATGSAFANTWKAQSTCADQVEKLEDPCSLSIESGDQLFFLTLLFLFQRCKYDTCLCKDSEECLCAALSSYSRACAFKGIVLGGWRQSVCSDEVSACPGNQVFLYNLTMCQQTCRSIADGEKYCLQDFAPVDGCGCPDNTYLDNQDTCVPISKCPCYYKGSYLEPGDYVTKDGERWYVLLHLPVCWDKTPFKIAFLSVSHLYQSECVSGCVCPEGLFDDGRGGCVVEEDCPCIHNSDWYNHGQSITVDCNTCTCQKGIWSCTENVCYGTCMIYGSGHYITFDGKFYDFDGSCEYVATQDYCGDKNSGGSFSIITENVPCGTTGVTCSKAIKMFIGKTELKLENKDYKEIQRDVGDDVYYQNKTVGLYLVIEASNGVMLIWDKKTTVFIKLTPDYKGKVCGLCGNFDGKSNNDFTSRSGLQETSALEFGNSWKQSSVCPDVTEEIKPCDLKPHRKPWAEKECSLILSEIFKICHSKVNPSPFYDACVHDACSCDSGGDCDCFCSAVAAYAQECTKAQACVFWRSPDICPIFCDYYNPRNECEWHYEPCGSNVMTCRMIYNVSTNFSVPYLEGCYPRCPHEKPIYNEETKECVAADECWCYHNGNPVIIGGEIPTEENCTKWYVKMQVFQEIISPCLGLICDWSEWFDVSNPEEDGGDYETYEEIRKEHGNKICAAPENIECRAKDSPDKTLEELGQKVECNVTYGLICKNEEQDASIWHLCYNYEIRVNCCEWHEFPCETASTPSSIPTASSVTTGTTVPTTTIRQSTTITTIPTPTATTTSQPTPSVTTPITSASTVSTTAPTPTPSESPTSTATTTPFSSSTQGTTPTVPGISSTTPTVTSTLSPPIVTQTHSPPPSLPEFRVHPCVQWTPMTNCECIWTDWIDLSQPNRSDVNSGDYETIDKINNSSLVCVKAENISCRAKDYPNISLEELGQKVECNVNTGLICNNKDQENNSNISYCHNYEVSICCTPNKPECLPTPEFTTAISTTLSHSTTTTIVFTSTVSSTTAPPTTTGSAPTTTSGTTTGASSPLLTPSGSMSPPSVSTVPSTVTTSGTTPTKPFTTTSGTTSSSFSTVTATTITTSEIVSSGSASTSGTTPISSTVTVSGSSTYSTVTTLSTLSSTASPSSNCTISPNETYAVSEFNYVYFCHCALVGPGESWWLCNCIQAICVENNTVVIVPVICEPPPKPTCSNGLAPVQVIDDDQCCWHWECDCYCTGWGDPHYLTFDGLYYSYQGNCTYVLVEEIEKTVDNFGVYIDNYHCDARDVVSCPRALIVRHETQEVRIVTVKPNTLEVEVTVNKQAVALPYKKFGLKIYESGINRVVEIPELKMNVTFNGLSFSIRMPYSLFGNNTQGQCGTCNNNMADDCRLPNGNIAENCETMADHWQVVDPSKPQCSPGLVPTKAPSTTTGQPCKESSLCELLWGSVFEKCHQVVKPDKYYAACVFDSCMLPDLDLECSSLQIYAAVCADQNVCIDWRSHTNGVCSYECPKHKEYRACGPIQETTCKSSPHNETSVKQVEGCFCPNGTMLYDSGVDVCVNTCGCVGLDMIPREFGEKFIADCQDCVCLEGGNGIVCEPHKCPEQNKRSCSGKGFYEVTEVNSEDPCCPIVTCKCNTSLCTTKPPKCTLGFEVQSYIPSDECCPVYQCVPKNVCVHQNAEFLPNSSVFVDKCHDCFCTNDVNISTQLNVISCEHIPCNTYCEPGYERKQVEGECCGKCVQTKCIIHTSHGSSLILNPQIWLFCIQNKTSCRSSLPICTLSFVFWFLAQNDVPFLHLNRYSVEASSMEHSCSCCKEVETSMKEVELKCPSGGSITHKYVYVESCGCQDTQCTVPESSESQSTEENDESARNHRRRAISLTSK
uniref:Mucin 2, oligomeric mucus/gel-forming n=1 Tax=Meleagris gallopavo TaxID=9103 RepID=A0A803XVQ8_MELGA